MTQKNNNTQVAQVTATKSKPSKPPVKTGGKPPKYEVNTLVQAKQYSFVSPNGKLFTTDNLTRFAKRFNLIRSSLSRVASGEYSQHKNWTAKSVA